MLSTKKKKLDRFYYFSLIMDSFPSSLKILLILTLEKNAQDLEPNSIKPKLDSIVQIKI